MFFLELQEVWQRREGKDILKNIDLRLERGEVHAIIGPTGSGKTTLLRLAGLLDKPASGRVLLDGIDVTATKKERLAGRRKMGFVLQRPVVFHASIYENIACGLRWRGLGGREERERVAAALEMVGLAGMEKRNARTLSGGEVQRVAIARAIATRPELLLLDEPTANLDPRTSQKIEELLAGNIRTGGITVLMATHDMAQGQRLADRISVLLDGSMVQSGRPDEIFYAPHSREVAGFVGVENILDGVVVSCEGQLAVIDLNGHHIETVADCRPGEKVTVMMRPEDITLALHRVSSSARNCLAGSITRTVFGGPLCRVEIDCGFRLVALVTRRSAEDMGLKEGRQVYASFKAVSLRVIRRG